jgi:Peptidase inhibitor I78 family
MRVLIGAAALAVMPLHAAIAAPPSPDTCRLALTRRFVGAQAVAEVRRALRTLAAPSPVRWIAPGQAITTDSNPARLNVILDEKGRIAVMRCG